MAGRALLHQSWSSSSSCFSDDASRRRKERGEGMMLAAALCSKRYFFHHHLIGGQQKSLARSSSRYTLKILSPLDFHPSWTKSLWTRCNGGSSSIQRAERSTQHVVMKPEGETTRVVQGAKAFFFSQYREEKEEEWDFSHQSDDKLHLVGYHTDRAYAAWTITHNFNILSPKSPPVMTVVCLLLRNAIHVSTMRILFEVYGTATTTAFAFGGRGSGPEENVHVVRI